LLASDHVWGCGVYKDDSLLTLGIRKTVAGVENGHIVDILHVTLLKIGRHAETFTQKVQGVESLGLGLGDRW
jgi:hypothetical protein